MSNEYTIHFYYRNVEGDIKASEAKDARYIVTTLADTSVVHAKAKELLADLVLSSPKEYIGYRLDLNGEKGNELIIPLECTTQTMIPPEKVVINCTVV